eukprot:snap_masked-scaffold711_size108467-processed-gene-0.7 protein:Tk04236 transcript:snap_masked-scaffold711_size108467-processed-gene-0.7-mRNA-1 annotation:"palmitoyltransferase zdhhc7"
MVFRRDPCGITCLLMTYGCVLYADYVVVRWIVLATGMHTTLWGATHVVLFNLIVFLLFMAHFRAVCSDPGIVPLPQHRIDFSDAHAALGHPGGATGPEPPEEDWTICTRCEMYRPPRAHHCRICQRCIRKMDHHCPWINNCVGEWNQKYFIQFLFYVGLLSAYAVFLIALSWYTPCPECPKDIHVKQTRILHSIILSLECVLFGMFVIAIGCDQFEAIFSDETLVEQAKRQGPYRPRKPKMTLLAEVCGRGHPLTWFLPCHTLPRTTEPIYHYSV